MHGQITQIAKYNLICVVALGRELDMKWADVCYLAVVADTTNSFSVVEVSFFGISLEDWVFFESINDSLELVVCYRLYSKLLFTISIHFLEPDMIFVVHEILDAIFVRFLAVLQVVLSLWIWMLVTPEVRQ